MQHLFSPPGRAALADVLSQRPLLAFDFDGTLTPIVPRPDDARLSRAVAARLASLAERLPVAIVTGRRVADVRERLGFVPQYIVGSHGAEDPATAGDAVVHAAHLQGIRARLALRAGDLQAAGVSVEDKGLSLALHYRLSRRRSQARALIAELLGDLGPGLRVFSGKMVENVVAADAPDKAAAVFSLVRRAAVVNAIFAGDDLNDEPVFAAAPANWLTVRVGRDDPRSRARYFLDSPAEMAMLLERMLEAVPPPR